MNSTSERSRQFLDFVIRIRGDNENNAGSMGSSSSKNKKDMTEILNIKENKKVKHMTRLTTVLEKSLLDKQEDLKQKQAMLETVVIDWSQSEDVCQELMASLNSYDSNKIKDASALFATSMDNFLFAESHLRKNLLLKASQEVCETNIDIGDQKHSDQKVNSDLLLEAQATVRYLEYKKNIEVQQTTALNSLHKTVNGSHFHQESAKSINRQQVIDKIAKNDKEIKIHHNKLRGLVSERLSVEQGIRETKHQHQRMANLNKLVDIQRTSLGELDQQDVRYATIQMSAEKDIKHLTTLQGRVTKINQILTNDANLTNKVKETHSFGTRGDYCPSQLEVDENIDERDKLLNKVKDLLMTTESLNGISDGSVSLKSLTQIATNSKISSDRNIDALADALPKLLSVVHNVEDKFTVLLNECKHMENTSTSSTTQAHIRQYNDHKNKVMALMSKLHMKTDTRNCANGMNEVMKLSFAETERNLIDLYLKLCHESNAAHAKELETEIIKILTNSTYE